MKRLIILLVMGISMLMAMSALAGASSKPTFRLDLRAPGHGDMKINPGHLTCTGTCFVLVREGKKVTLTALPDDGYAVNKWQGCPKVSDGMHKKCTFRMTSDMTVKVLFKSSNAKEGSDTADVTTGDSAEGAVDLGTIG